MKVKGGPGPWLNLSIDHIRSVHAERENLIQLPFKSLKPDSISLHPASSNPLFHRHKQFTRGFTQVAVGVENRLTKQTQKASDSHII